MSLPAAPAAAQPPEICAPLWITADCLDLEYADPVIDRAEDRPDPVPHHRVSGHFQGTDKRFTIALPPKQQFQGRFFQHVYPLTDENPTGDDVAFGADSGAYTVQTNGGSGFRADAAAAKFAERVAADHYGWTGRIYGYVWGGSGGSYQTLGAAENSTGVWDGAVPYIVGVPTSIPSNFFIRALARLVLQDKATQIADAVAPGGSGDPYADLDDTERAVLTEVTNMGVPLRSWEDYPYVLGLTDSQAYGLLGFGDQVRTIDPGYADDFWSKPGYLGTDPSPLGDLFRAARVDQLATVTQVERDAQDNPTRLLLDAAPANPRSTPLDIALSAPDGATGGTVSGTVDPATRTITLTPGTAPEVLQSLDAGATVRIDNRWPLALTAYPRHQVPPTPGFAAFDQYRGPDGQPLHPQRPIPMGPAISTAVSGGGTHTGHINGKVIAVCNLLDSDAFPWDGDWYRGRVRHALGGTADDSFRLWYNDNADHIAPGRTDRLVDYTGILQQALRDVSAWAETGSPPAPSTNYQVHDNQITVPAAADERHGIQPVVDLTADGTDHLEVPAGTSVTLHATIRTPPGTGPIVRTDWNPTGTGEFVTEPLPGPPADTLEATHTVTYDTPGTYFPELRATAQRDGDPNTPYATVHNLGRVRITVR
ncbi:hypothetical protein [Nocardia sp. BMG51109]|uniref:hypothetical protein n=1 Tax=Nocardia sp. BMG51109 TaxID=1056816 RepID=UPI000688B49A|nr:hypothetical protein [Nocardia sp. BMG51109]